MSIYSSNISAVGLPVSWTGMDVIVQDAHDIRGIEDTGRTPGEEEHHTVPESAFEVEDIVWYLCVRNVPRKPRKLTK